MKISVGYERGALSNKSPKIDIKKKKSDRILFWEVGSTFLNIIIETVENLFSISQITF